MIVKDSNINMRSSHNFEKFDRNVILRQVIETPLNSDEPSTRLDLSKESIHRATNETVQSLSLSQTEQMESMPEVNELDPQLMVLLKTLEYLTGKKLHVNKINMQNSANNTPSLSSYSHSIKNPDNIAEENILENSDTDSTEPNRKILTYSERTRYEHEETTFEAAGIILTSDGKEIDITIELNMSRTFLQTTEELNVSYTDPLVINWGGKASDLTETKFEFDLDADGIKEKISMVKPESGAFLAYDRNGDGIINNGNELFGPSSGNGFTELAAFDEDENNWIDENDSVFKNLSVWTKDTSGKDILTAIVDTQIGAIYLNSSATEFNLTKKDNTLLGKTKSTGIYLNNDGSAGTVQQVDLITG